MPATQTVCYTASREHGGYQDSQHTENPALRRTMQQVQRLAFELMEMIMTTKHEILEAYQEWKSDKKNKYRLTDDDQRVANIAAMYSESELRHATVMRAALKHIQPKPLPRITPSPQNAA